MERSSAVLPSLGHLSVALLYADLARMQERAGRVPLFGDEVWFAGAVRGGVSETRERVSVMA